MNLKEKYMAEPRCYILTAPEGYGKSTSLRDMYYTLAGQKINNQIIIPIYIRMADLNTMPDQEIQNGVLLGYINEKYYKNSMAINRYKALREMIKETVEEYRYLFLLDGMNEVNNRLLYESGQRVFQCIENELTYLDSERVRFIDYSNVDIIISARKEGIISDSLKEKMNDEQIGRRSFRVLEIEKMHADQIVEYLNLDNINEISEDLREQLETPMLLNMYRRIKEEAGENSEQFKTRIELLDNYYRLDSIINRNTKQIDNWDEIRADVLGQVIPLIAFEVENWLLKKSNDKNNGNYDIEEPALEEVLEKISPLINLRWDKSLLVRALGMLQIVNEKLQFQHDMIREYWAVKGLNLHLERKEVSVDVIEFFENLYANIEREKHRFDIARQTRHLGVVETLYSFWKQNNCGFNRIWKRIYACVYGQKDENWAKQMVFNIVFGYSSIMDDLNERRKAAELGWEAYDLFQEVENLYPEEERAFFLNDIAFCTNNHVINERNPLLLFEKARELMDKIEPNQQEHEGEFAILYGKIINNFGSYYYGKYERDYETSLKYHEEAKKYREIHNLDLTVSFRAISSDYYQMGNYIAAYKGFQDYLFYCTKKRRLSQMTTEEKKKVKDVIQIVNVLGSEYEILSSKVPVKTALKKEIQKEVSVQMEMCYKMVQTESRRKALDTIKKLDEKNKDFKRLNDILKEQE